MITKTLAYLSIFVCYIKYIIKLILKHSITSPLYIGVLFLFFVAFSLYSFFNKVTNDSLNEQIQHRQQVAVRLTAGSIESLLNSVGRSVMLLPDKPTQKDLDEFMKAWSEASHLTGISYINKDGIVETYSNISNIPNPMIDVSDREYFIWAKSAKTKEFKIFSPIISRGGLSAGQYVIPIASPRYSSSGTFQGVIATSIPLSSISVNYLDSLKVLDSSRTRIVKSNGEIIFSDQQDLIGKTLSDIFKDDFLGKDYITNLLRTELRKDGENKLNLAIPNYQNDFKLEPYLISASPVHISGETWKVVAITSENSLLAFNYKIFNSKVILIFVFAVVFIALTAKMIREVGYKDAVVDEHKRHNIK